MKELKWKKVGKDHYGLSFDIFTADVYKHKGKWFVEVGVNGKVKAYKTPKDTQLEAEYYAQFKLGRAVSKFMRIYEEMLEELEGLYGR